MQNNPSPLFVKCPRCGGGNPPALKACRNCRAQQVGAQSFKRQAPMISDLDFELLPNDSPAP